MGVKKKIARTGAAALIRGRRLLTIPLRVRRLIKGGAYSGAARIRVNTVIKTIILSNKVFYIIGSVEK